MPHPGHSPSLAHPNSYSWLLLAVPFPLFSAFPEQPGDTLEHLSTPASFCEQIGRESLEKESTLSFLTSERPFLTLDHFVI